MRRMIAVPIDGAAADAPAGEGEPFDAFFEAHYVRLARALYLLTGNAAEAEDLAQDAMLRVYERWERVSTMGSPVGYLFRTALNLHRSAMRHATVRLRRRSTPSPVDQLGAAEDRDDIGRLLATLPEGQRAALILVEWVGMTAEEAGQALGIEAVSVRVRISRAKATMRATDATDVGETP